MNVMQGAFACCARCRMRSALQACARAKQAGSAPRLHKRFVVAFMRLMNRANQQSHLYSVKSRAVHQKCAGGTTRVATSSRNARDEICTGTYAKSLQSRAQASAVRPVPQSIHDVDNGNILGFGEELSEDHPGFHDSQYKARRAMISKQAKAHEIGAPMPVVHYKTHEVATWGSVMRRLEPLLLQYGCREFIDAFQTFEFDEGRIPQLQEVQATLQAATGWSVRPVAGLMHPRDFLAGLAYRTFHSTQYIRHHSQPMYTPEPDVVHEILGHVPMLVNPHFCRMVEAIGQASLGADDKEIWHLTKVYWYTVEFGVVMEGRDVKAFGAGILSSYGELEWMGSGKAQILPFDPWRPLPKMSYKDGYQKQYFCLPSFEEGASMLEQYAAQSGQLPR